MADTNYYERIEPEQTALGWLIVGLAGAAACVLLLLAYVGLRAVLR